MRFVSNTGLIATVPKRQNVKSKSNTLDPEELCQLCEVTTAPYMLRPYAGLYNPFSNSCSVLCNHPADREVRMTVMKAKKSMELDGRAQTYGEDLSALPRITDSYKRDTDIYRSFLFSEDMLRKYTQTDSRPLTPAPTLVSGKSRGSRRCFTPDEPSTKTSIVVDLRRSHSQDTFSVHGYTTDIYGDSTNENKSTLPSVITISDSDGGNTNPGKRQGDQLPPLESPLVSIRRANVNEPVSVRNKKEKSQLKALNIAKPTKSKTKQANGGSTRKAKGEKGEKTKEQDKEVSSEPCTEQTHDEVSSNETRRRGKRRRKGRMVGSDRLTSAGLAAQTQPDPETQIAGIGTDSNNASSRGSISVPPNNLTDDVIIPLPSIKKPVITKKSASFLDDDILKFLHREVDEEAIETEFDIKRRYVLKEALRTRPDRPYGDEMQTLLREMKIPAVCLGDWLHIPRVFSRQNVQFSLPIDYSELEYSIIIIFDTTHTALTPMQYAARHATLKKSKQLLYLTVLRRFRPEGYRMPIKDLEEGLMLMMGGILTKENVEKFKALLDWESYEEQENIPDEIILKSLEEEYINSKVKGAGDFKEPEPHTIKFRTWCGLCGICERMYGRFPPRNQDPPNGIELSDFTMVEAKLSVLTVHPGLVEVIRTIKNR